jgi:hypothetical protein
MVRIGFICGPMAKENTIWNNSWIVTIFGGLVLYIICKLLDLVFNIHIWSWLITLMSIPRWLMIILVLCCIIALIRFLKGSFRHQDVVPSEPPYAKYRADKFEQEDAVISWQYRFGSNSYDIYDIVLICLSDNTKIVGNYCPKCNRKYLKKLSNGQIKALIDSKIRNDKWQYPAMQYKRYQH